jgi:GTP-binding protein
MIVRDIKLAATAFSEKELISDQLPKILFMGRSNVGKSSLINKILNRKKLAKTSSTPGKTVSINYYLINKQCYFIDLPGYGYAKISKSARDRVNRLVSVFFERVTDVKLIFILIDSRRGFLSPDIENLARIINKGFKMLTVLTKGDKIKNSELISHKKNLQKKYGLGVIAFSIKSEDYKKEILEIINKALTE